MVGRTELDWTALGFLRLRVIALLEGGGEEAGVDVDVEIER